MMLILLWLMTRKSREPQVEMAAATLFPFVFWSAFYYITTVFPRASLMTGTVVSNRRFVPRHAENMNMCPDPVRAASPIVFGSSAHINAVIGTALIVMAASSYTLCKRGVGAGELDSRLLS